MCANTLLKSWLFSNSFIEQPHLSKITNITKWITLVGLQGLAWRQLFAVGQWEGEVRGPGLMETQGWRPLGSALRRRTWASDVCKSRQCLHGVAGWWQHGRSRWWGVQSPHFLFWTLPKPLQIQEYHIIWQKQLRLFGLTLGVFWSIYGNAVLKCVSSCPYFLCTSPLLFKPEDSSKTISPHKVVHTTRCPGPMGFTWQHTAIFIARFTEYSVFNKTRQIFSPLVNVVV